METLGSSFVAQAKAALALHPELTHQWVLEDGDLGTLRFLAADSAGIEILVEIEPKEITVYAGRKQGIPVWRRF